MMVFTMREPCQWWIVETGEERERRERGPGLEAGGTREDRAGWDSRAATSETDRAPDLILPSTSTCQYTDSGHPASLSSYQLSCTPADSTGPQHR